MIKALFTHPLYIKINQSSFTAKNLALDEGGKHSAHLPPSGCW